jgi:hypothetical protein
MIEILRNGKTTACGIIVFLVGAADCLHAQTLTPNGMGFMVAGISMILGRDFNVSRLP